MPEVTKIVVKASSSSGRNNLLKENKKDDEVALLESQLTASIRLQIENIRAGISQMEGMSAQILPRSLPAQLASIVDLCNQTDAMISNYSFIKLVSRTCANFKQTHDIYEQFRVLDTQIERVNELLQTDQESGRLNNLLLIYCRLAQLGDFRDRTMELVKNSSSSLVYQLKRYFKKLDDLEVAFDSYYWALPGQLPVLAKNPQRAADLVKIAQVLNRMPVVNRSRFFELIDGAVSAKFSSIEPKRGADFDEVLGAMDFYQDDLKVFRDRLSPRFPANSGLLDFYLLAYHRNIHGILGKLLSLFGAGAGVGAGAASKPAKSGTAGGLGAGQILALLAWVKEYHDALENEFGIAAEELEPHLLDDREPRLIADYVRLSRAKITEWIKNLLNSESKYFVERKALPDADGDDRYFTPATVDLFQIVKQHVDMAAGVSNDRLLSEIVSECVSNIGTFQKGLIRVMEQEAHKFSERPEAVAAYFEDYVIMMGNSSLRWIENMQNLMDQMEDLLKPEYLGPAHKQLKGASDGFLQVAKAASKVLEDIIAGAVRVCFTQLFVLEWYTDAVMETITATYEDFFTDYRGHAEEFLVSKLIADVLDRTVLMYIEAMRSKNARLKLQQHEQSKDQQSSNQLTAAELLDRDIATLLRFFAQFRDERKVERSLDPLIKLRTLLIASEKMIFLETLALLKAYPDVPLSVIEELLGKRDNLDRTTVKELMLSVRKKLQEEKPMESNSVSVFSKLKIVTNK